MPVLGITGGVATGKSSFTAELAVHLAADVFDADRCAHELLSGNEAVREEIRSAFGVGVFDAEGAVSRSALRHRAFSDIEARMALERILHPRIRAAWVGIAEKARNAPGWLLVDIPLLFETGAEGMFIATLLVAASYEKQLDRLKDRRRLDEATARRMIETQMPMTVKITSATHVIWNDGSVGALQEQARIAGALLRELYGRKRS